MKPLILFPESSSRQCTAPSSVVCVLLFLFSMYG